jgi:glycosyltransferase involved in cell wall biosynthesis
VRLLFLAVHRPGRSPSQRFRFEQFQPWLESQGVQTRYASLLSEADDRVAYGPGKKLTKAAIALRAAATRGLQLVQRIDRGFDVAFVQREAFFAGPAFFELGLKRTGLPLVYDFDDAVWMPNVSPANRVFGALKFPGKVDSVIRAASEVIAGNYWLAEHARALNPSVTVIPTVVNTDAFDPPIWSAPREGPVTIGWTGSAGTLEYLKPLLPALRRVQERCKTAVRFKFIGVPDFKPDALDAEVVAWRESTEVDELRALDIGLMPAPDDQWARGKCGCKGLQYMALGIPAVMSPVGVAKQIATEGQTGFLPATADAWVDTLCRLVEDSTLRRRVGEAGRAVAREKYSVRAWREQLLAVLKRAAGRRA